MPLQKWTCKQFNWLGIGNKGIIPAIILAGLIVFFFFFFRHSFLWCYQDTVFFVFVLGITFFGVTKTLIKIRRNFQFWCSRLFCVLLSLTRNDNVMVIKPWKKEEEHCEHTEHEIKQCPSHLILPYPVCLGSVRGILIVGISLLEINTSYVLTIEERHDCWPTEFTHAWAGKRL